MSNPTGDALRAAEETTEPQLSDFLAKWEKIYVLPSEQEHMARLEHSHALQLWLRAKVASLTAACREKDEELAILHAALVRDRATGPAIEIAKLRDRVREMEAAMEYAIKYESGGIGCVRHWRFVFRDLLKPPGAASDAT